MLQRDRQIRTQIFKILDACLFAMAFWIAYELRLNPDVMMSLNLAPFGSFENFLWLFVILVPVSPLVLGSQGFYNRSIFSPRRDYIWPLLKGCVLITMGLILMSYVLHLVVARLAMIWFGAISFGLEYFKEELLRLVFKSKFAQSQYRRRFVLAGTEREIDKMRHGMQQQSSEGITIIDELNINQVGTQELVTMLHEHSVNGVILSAKHASFDQIENIIKVCELEGVEIWLVADFFATQISRTSLDELQGRPLLVFRTTPEFSWQSVLKQCVDFFGATFLLLLVGSWLFPLIAIAIKLTSPGPVLFRQKRSGLNGAPFTLFKFRTMVTNAEQLKNEIEILNEMRGPVFKVTNDPRITPIGRWLRRYSFDEWPQLFNVLRGEMSLVGPRPLPVDEVKRFDDFAHRRRLSVKPGITCLWQVSGRNQIADFNDWVRLDLQYIDNWSLWLDFKILLLTTPAVLRGTGAK